MKLGRFRWPFVTTGCISILIGGCSSDISKILPTAPAALSAGVTQFQDLEANIINEFQSEDAILRYLSRGRYSCGDPDAVIIKKYTTIKNPKKYVLSQYETWNVSVNVINYYSDYLKQIVDDDRADQETIKN